MSFDRTPEQRMDALKTANDVRQRRAKLKDELKSDATRVFFVLAEPPDYASGMKVADLLMAVRGMGLVKTNKVLGACHLTATKKIGAMTPHQRGRLSNELRRAYSSRMMHQRATRVTSVIHASTNVHGASSGAQF